MLSWEMGSHDAVGFVEWLIDRIVRLVLFCSLLLWCTQLVNALEILRMGNVDK